jgi:GNAT superfamily N-acetyltransferase
MIVLNFKPTQTRNADPGTQNLRLKNAKHSLLNTEPLLHSDLIHIPSLQPEGWYNIQPIHAFYTSVDFCFPLKLMIDGRMAGIGTGIVHGDVAWLGHIIVHPDFRNRGLGGIITKALVEQMHAKNCKTIYLIATELGEPVYKKIGFETETEYVFFKDLVKNIDWNPSAEVIPYNPSHKDQIIEIDRFVSGENRMVHLERFLSNGFVHMTDDIVNGFYLPDFGDGVILATKLNAGLDLMRLRLAAKDNASFPIDNVDALRFMRDNNFQEFRKAKRMRLGPERELNLQFVYNRIGGNVG